MMRAAAVAAFLAGLASPAFAQGPYVSASIGGDIVRVSGADGVDTQGSGEAVSWSLRVGTPIASRFGVELEFAHPQEITETTTPDVRILKELQGVSYRFVDGVTVPGSYTVTPATVGLSPIVFPPINISVTTSQRNTTLATTAWVRQQVTSRFALQYLGGISFNRITREFSYSTTGVPNIFAGLVPRSQRSIEYAVGPVVGTEARIGMTEHLQLVPGVRLQTIADGWLVRPAVSLAWEF
jgi:hypothetical protein